MARSLAFCTLLWLACSGDGAEDVVAVEPRASVVLAHELPSSSGPEHYSVRDLVWHDGELVMLVIRDRIDSIDPFTGPRHRYTPTYLVSADQGRSWREQPIAFASPADHFSRDSIMFPTSLLSQDGVLYELVTDWVELETRRVHSLLVYQIDLDAGLRRRVGEVPDVERIVDGQDGLLTYEIGLPVAGTRYVTLTNVAIPSGEKVEIDGEYAEPEVAACALGLWHASGDGIAMTCHNWLYGACDWKVQPSLRVTPLVACVGADDWPFDEAGASVQHLPRGRFVTTTDAGTATNPHVEQVDILGQWQGFDPVAHHAELKRTPVGPGELHPRYQLDDFGRSHERFAGLIALFERLDGSDTRTTLYRRDGHTYRASALPTRPCAANAPCGFLPDTAEGGRHVSPLEWIMGLGDDTYLVVYIVNAGTRTSGTSRHRIYVGREVERAPDVQREGGLVAACMRATACPGPLDIGNCVRHWSAVPDAARYEAFLAATDCAVVDALQPNVALYEKPCTADSTSECVSGVPTSCNVDGERAVGFVCSDYGLTCVADAEASCVGDVPASPEPACAAADLRVCVDGSAVHCSDVGSAGSRQHCARIDGFMCEAGRCVASAPTGDCNLRCEGDVMTFCFENAAVAADCAVLGGICSLESGICE